jgi:GNAT superfamily N-acetyltransferase
MLLIRPATVDGVPLLRTMIRELAESPGRPRSSSNLFVRSPFRGKGIGMGLLTAVARIAMEERRCAMRWEVLNWNEPAIKLYQALGAEFHDQWRSALLPDDALRQLAEKAS